jgi:hypothetical protein
MFEGHEESLKRLPPAKRCALLGHLFNYVFRGINQNDIRSFLAKSNIEFDFLSWRLQLHSNGQLLKCGKIFLFSQVTSPIKGVELGLSRIEQNQAILALQHGPLAATLKSQAKTYALITPQALDDLIGKTLTSADYTTYVRKFIHRKMSFLQTSFGWTDHQLEGELNNWALYGLLRAYPCYATEGHAIAIAKTVAKRRGINLISELTTAKNNELIKTKTGFEKTTVSLSSISDGTGQFLTPDGTTIHNSLLIVGIDGRPNTGMSWSMQTTIRDLRHNPKLTEKQRQLLHILLGYPSSRFSEFLGEDNTEAVHSMSYPTYFGKACQFMRLNEELASRFLFNLKTNVLSVSD